MSGRLTRKVREYRSYMALYMKARGRKTGLLHDAGSPEAARRIQNSLRQAAMAKGLAATVSGQYIHITGGK